MAAKLPDGTAELLQRLSEQPNLVPDELTVHLMRRSGVDCEDEQLVRLVSLAAQRFMASVIFDSLQLCKARLASATKKQLRAAGYRDKRVLTTEDLARALKEVGVNLRQPPYVVDAVPAAGVAGAAGAASTGRQMAVMPAGTQAANPASQ